MKKIWYRRILNGLLFMGIIGLAGYGYVAYDTVKKDGSQTEQEVSARSLKENTVLLGGMPVGIYMETEGVMVLGTQSVENQEGIKEEPAKNLVKAGDYIVGINGEKVENKKELSDCVKNLEKETVILQIRRDREEIDLKMTPVSVSSKERKLGIWVRDNLQGLGTITFLTRDSRFGALGHGIHDVDTNGLVEIAKGSLYATNIRTLMKGRAGMPGSLEGIIVYNSFNRLGEIEKNTEAGIYGKLEKVDRLFEEEIAIEVAKKEEICTGPAQIRCCIGDEICYYDVEILDVDLTEKEVNKGMIVRVTDPKLLEETGGIIQGMSGSPIVQNGKLIGAVTHVFVNHPEKGYGIFAETMLELSGENFAENQTE